MSVARWTPSSMLERVAEEEARVLARANRRLQFGLLAFLFGAPLSCLALYVGPLAAAGALVYACVALALVSRASSAKERETWLAGSALREEFGKGGGWLVDLTILQGDAATGLDRGMVWVEDERLYFAGRRTSFGLTADQAAGRCRMTPPLEGQGDDLRLSLRTRTAAGPVSLSLGPAFGAKWQDRQAAYDLRTEIDCWVDRNAAAGGQLPPLTLGPHAPPPGRLLLRAVVAGSYWVVLVGLVLGFGAIGKPVPALSVATMGWMLSAVWPPAGAFRTRVRAYRDRRLLEALP